MCKWLCYMQCDFCKLNFSEYGFLTLNFLKWIFTTSRLWSINQKSVLLAQCFKNTLWLSDFSSSSFSYHRFSSHYFLSSCSPTEKYTVEPLSLLCSITELRLAYKNTKSLIPSPGAQCMFKGKVSSHEMHVGWVYTCKMKRRNETESRHTTAKTYVWTIMRTEARLSKCYFFVRLKCIWIFHFTLHEQRKPW